MEKTIEKLVAEQQNLLGKMTELISFVYSKEFYYVGDTYRTLVYKQIEAMEIYNEALLNRLHFMEKVFSSKKEVKEIKETAGITRDNKGRFIKK